MDDALLKNGPMSFDEHTDYHPIIDELVFYVTQWHDEQSKLADSSDKQEFVSNN